MEMQLLSFCNQLWRPLLVTEQLLVTWLHFRSSEAPPIFIHSQWDVLVLPDVLVEGFQLVSLLSQRRVQVQIVSIG